MASSLALLTLSGRPQVAVQVLCGGTACRTETFLDADKPVVRFVAPGPGPLVVRLHNGGVENGVVLTLQRAQVCPARPDDMPQPSVVASDILLTHGTRQVRGRGEDMSCL
ncbi:uncharacterized protein LOC127749376 [Frankliniella occidentalis]|uniref:Uncharacterized protein LOC127749376 n=1 Tax=Frankliniella occidentalis TaxID=133901 RepID=A0A9C6UB12_FRAOC|nr:uncharacterized protein LOC127749376 [Frankliniella occidentalis]